MNHQSMMAAALTLAVVLSGPAQAGGNAGSLGDLQRAFQDYLLGGNDAFRVAVRDSR